MRIVAGILLSLLLHSAAVAQTIEEKHHRILLVLDASWSMNERFDSTHTRYQAAAAFIIQLMDSIYKRNDEVEFGLRVYGHQYPSGANQCYDTKSEVMFSRDNYEQMKMRLADIKPKGISNTYAALSDALTYDVERHDGYYYHLILLTDGGEACSRDVCAVANTPAFKNLTGLCVIGVTNKLYYECLGKGLHLSQGEAALISELINTCCSIPVKEKRVVKTVVNTAELKPAVLKQVGGDKLPLAEPKPMQVNSNIPVFNPKTAPVQTVAKPIGYLVIKEISGTGNIRIYELKNGEPVFLKELKADDKIINQRIALPEGKYRLVYENDNTSSRKEFNIIHRMITEVYY